ncbi:MAG: hypothetical protein LBD02_11180, partial [Christensenellaceae bacterium]|nr:hypothetical protein [Christensenellaceae bacterium]
MGAFERRLPFFAFLRKKATFVAFSASLAAEAIDEGRRSALGVEERGGEVAGAIERNGNGDGEAALVH